MTKIALRLFLVHVAAVALAGCGSSEYLGKPKEVDPNIFPAKYKDEIVFNLKNSLIDPTNVKDAFISEPVLGSIRPM